MALKSYNRGIRQLIGAPWVAENSYGTSYPITTARGANLQYVLESDELRGDDVVADRFSKLVAVNVTVQEGVIDLDIFKMWMGGTLANGTGYYDWVVKDTDEIPYIALAGRVVGSGGKGDLHFFIPKAKMSGNLQINAQVDAYLIPQADFQGINEGSINGMLRFRHFLVSTPVAIPLPTSS